MTLTIEYTGPFDGEKEKKLMDAIGPSTFESIFDVASNVRRMVFHVSDAATLKSTIDACGVELSKSEVNS